MPKHRPFKAWCPSSGLLRIIENALNAHILASRQDLRVLTVVIRYDGKFLVSYKSTQIHLVLVLASPVRHLLT